MENPKLSNDDNGTALETVFRMNSGDGPNSYAANSTSQRTAMLKTRTILEESVKRVYTKTLSTNHFAVADLGCATGPNSLEAATTIIEAIYGMCISLAQKPVPEILVFLNDLPGNDFNSIIVTFPCFYENLQLKKNEDEEEDMKCFMSAMPGSFYGRLFPSKNINFVHSAMSLHWLSQVPNGLEHNKMSICMDTTSHDSVLEAYSNQFQSDFTLFLRSRAHEIIPQGEMVLTFICRTKPDLAKDKDSVYHWELLSECLVDMAAEGLIEEKDVDSFNMPLYIPYEDEVRELVEKEASFAINKLETIYQNIGPFNSDEEDTRLTAAKMIVLGVRAAMEPLLNSHFGKNLVMGDLFERLERKVDKYLFSVTTAPIIWAFIILSATKI